ncbi:MAG: ferrochelatase, partial [Pseudobdellovibrio sp.]
PRRRFSSSEKYKKIWTDEGSPLAVNTEKFRKKLQVQLGSEWIVLTGMRYGEPSILSALKKINYKSNDEIYFLPLYPQYADATVGSAVAKLNQDLKKLKLTYPYKVIEPFYNQNWYIQAMGELIRRDLKSEDHLLLSFHGIPVSQEQKSKISYQNHCVKTFEALKMYLGLNDNQISYSFQSRVGMAKWLEPSTEAKAAELAQNGVKSLKVACPSFVADCLETIEEIGMELKDHYLHAGGEKFELIPCLNSDDLFVSGFSVYLKALL